MKPEYWDRAKRTLARGDPVMQAIIRSRPRVFLMRRGEPFLTLARAICGQQISVKAAQSVWDRFAIAVAAGSNTASSMRLSIAGVQALASTQMREAGLSARKCEYLQDLAGHFADGRVHVDQWQAMDDEDKPKSFEEALREIADEVQRGIARFQTGDLEDVARTYGVDA